MRRLIRGVAVAVALLLAGEVSAHAILVGSQPKEASEVAGPDVEVALEFNSRIDQARSSLMITRAAATPQELAPVGAGPQPLSLIDSSEPNKLEAKAAGLEPGTYKLRWQVLSVDGHVSRGDVTFKVRAP
jgi:copper resistance protein C